MPAHNSGAPGAAQDAGWSRCFAAGPQKERRQFFTHLNLENYKLPGRVWATEEEERAVGEKATPACG